LDRHYNQDLSSGGGRLAKYFDEKYQVLRDGKLPITNMNDMVKHNQDLKAKDWKNLGANIAKLGDKGYSYGSFNYTDAKGQAKEGYYFRFWKRDANNQWKIFMDMVN